jgi:hypothetical protein
MSDLLETVLEAHGGLTRWNRLQTVSAPRTPDGQALGEPLIVSIDVSEIAFA